MDEDVKAAVTWLTTFRALICALGTLGNLAVIFVILALREYKKSITHWYVLHLAIADTVFLLTLPFKILEDARNNVWIYSNGMCKFVEAIFALNYYSSCLFLVVMSIDRYIAVCHAYSTSLQKLRTQLAAHVITGVVWGVSMLPCIPLLLYTNKQGYEPNCTCDINFPNPAVDSSDDGGRDLCAPHEAYDIIIEYSGEYEDGDDEPETTTQDDLLQMDTTSGNGIAANNMYDCNYHHTGTSWKRYLSFNFVGMFLIPLAVIAFCYILIIVRLIKGRARSDGEVGGSMRRKRSSNEDKKRQRVTVVCGLLIACFIACWLPFHTAHLAKFNGIKLNQEDCETLLSVVTGIAYLNSAINPYLYNFIGTRFWERLRSASGVVSSSMSGRRSSRSSSGDLQMKFLAKKQGDTRIAPTKIYLTKHTEAREDHTSADATIEDNVLDENRPSQEEVQAFVRTSIPTTKDTKDNF